MRFYRLLLRFYPASFRNEYGADMCAIFGERRRVSSSLTRRAALWLTTIADTFTSAALAHVDLLRQDLRYTMRTLRRSPGFSITAVLILALGIGATTAAFSVTDFALIRPLPFRDPTRLVKVWERTPGYSRLELSPANYRDWKNASTVFESMGSYYTFAANLVGAGEPLRLEYAAVSADVLPTLGVEPLLGRPFVAGDDRTGAPATAILSYRLWQTSFGADAGVIGRQIRLDDESYTIIGIMPREFRFPDPDVQLWRTQRFGEDAYADRNDNWLDAVARLRPGITMTQASAEMKLLAAQSEARYPKENRNTSATVVRLNEVSQRTRLLLTALCAAAGCVLLIACANLANLLLARGLERRRELAVRTAIGAGRERMIRQLMTESLVLCALGGVLGVVLANAAVPLLTRLVPSTLPVADAPGVDVRVLLFAIALSLGTGLAFGLAPVLRVGGPADLTALRDGARTSGGRREHLRSALVVAEIVASVTLLASAGLLLRTLWRVQATDPGFRAEHVLTLQTALPLPKFGNVAARTTFYRRVLGDVKALPGVENAAYVSFLPMGAMRGGIWPVSVRGEVLDRSDNNVAFLRYVTPEYFATLGIPILHGRDVSESDTADRQSVAVVSESFARRYWPGEDPGAILGRRFSFVLSDRVIVGIVRDVRLRGLEVPSEPQVYIPYQQVADGAIIGYIPKGLVVRTSTAPETLAPSVRAIVRRIDPTLPVTDVAPLEDLVERDTASRAVQVRVLSAFAVIAFLLAAVGIHGLLSFAVSQRAQEIGVRIALGAQSGDILRLVIGRSTMLAAIGVAIGVPLAYAAARTMRALLVGVTPADIPSFAAAVLLAMMMTLLGTLVPTLRAVRVDPIIAIRAE